MHLAARMPPPQIGSRGLMDLRLARKIAALSGIPGDPDSSDDAGRGRAWLVDYGRLTTTEITLGGPIVQDQGNPDGGLFLRPSGTARKFRHRDGEINFWPIPNVEVGRYGPDTKAALVLSGTNYLLKPLTAAIRTALSDICRQVDSPALVIAVGLCLLQEVFAAQPILVRNGVQATKIQRSLLRLPLPQPTRLNPHDRPLARIELGGAPGVDFPYHPDHLDLIHSTWDSIVASGQYDEQGSMISDPKNRLQFKPRSGFEQNEALSTTGRPETRDWAVGMLEELSEALLTGFIPGLPLCTIRIEDPATGTPFPEVVIPRQRQVEVMVAIVARQFTRTRLGRPIQLRGRVLGLPVLDPTSWLNADVLTRRAILLAHYYALRAAGWLSGMVKFDNRRSREECATRCGDLLEASAALLTPDDPLRDQIEAFAFGYRAQIGATFGDPTNDYQSLLSALDRMERRVRDGDGGKAVLIETLPLVLENLRTIRRAAFHGVCPGPSVPTLTEDLERWWATAHRLRDELIEDHDERSHLDYGYASFLLDPASDDDSLARGLRLMNEVIDSREGSARREGRWIGLRAAYLSYLRGLGVALDRRTDEDQARGYARQAFTRTRAVHRHRETWAYIDQRVAPRGPGGPGGYDGNVVEILAGLIRGWLAALRDGSLDETRRAEAREGGSRAVGALRGYLDLLRDPGHDVAGSRLDGLRAAVADGALSAWQSWENTHCHGNG